MQRRLACLGRWYHQRGNAVAASALGNGQCSRRPAQLTTERELAVDGDVCKT